ncbi:hypothetical protein AgCh_039250 [Apium graveolens]
MIGDRALLSNVVEKAGPVVTFGDNSKGLTEGYGCLLAGNVIIENVDEVLKLNQFLKTELEKEREIIRTWTNSGRITQNLLSSGHWKEGLGYADDKSETESEQIKLVIVKQTTKPKLNPVKFVVKSVKSDSEKMKDTETEGKAKSTSDKLKHDKIIEVNIGFMTKKQLKYKLKEIKNVNKGNRKNILVLDSGCSEHMIGNKALLSDFVERVDPGVSYRDGNMGKTLGYDNINLGNVIIEKVALVSGLKNNLLSVSQICDRGYHVDFFEEHCEVLSKSTGKAVLKGYRLGNIYEAKFSTSSDVSAICLLSRASIEKSWDWHKKLSHLNFNNIIELVKKDLVRGLPKSVFSPDGLLNVMSIAKKKYAMVIVDEFTRYTWVYFLHTKSETASILIDHVKQLDKLVKDSVKIIRSDNGTEFKNLIMKEFCKDHGIKQEFFAPGTPQ